MEDLKLTFIRESTATLEKLRADLSEKSRVFKRKDILRSLHTIKGTAETFGLSAAARLAHQLETVVSPAQHTEDFDPKLIDGIKFLARLLEEEDFELPQQFLIQLETIESAAPDEGYLYLKLPEDTLSGLSATERTAAAVALGKGQNLYCLDVSFGLENFRVGLIKLSEALGRSGEVIAIFPGRHLVSTGSIGFRVLAANSAVRERIEIAVRDFDAKIRFDSSTKIFQNDLPGILAQINNYGTELAARLGKTISFVGRFEDCYPTTSQKLLIYEMLVHLIRNACDHAFEKSGRIEVELVGTTNGLIVRVSDDGKGLDAEKIRRLATEKGLISADAVLTEQATLDLIFQSDFSTVAEVSVISGRGTGLDAVRNAANKAGGQVTVSTGNGTTFKIFLPKQEENEGIKNI